MRIDRLLILFMLVALALRLFFCFQPAEVLIPKVVSDDMFYYLTIAGNVASGYGATADRENETNGFHPLWVIVLVPLFKLFGRGAELQWALALLTLFSVLTAWFIYKILRFSCGEIPSFAAAVIWLGSPYTVLIALSGVEAPLFVLMASAASYCYLKISRGDSVRGGPLSHWVLLGVLMGAAVLARIDGALLAAIIFIDSLIGRRRNATPVEKRLIQAFSYGIACALVTLPWFIWSHLKTGLIFQMSGKAIHHQQHVLFWSQYRDAGPMRYAVGWCANVLSNAQAAIRSITVLCGASSIALLIVALLFVPAFVVIFVRSRPLAIGWLRRSASFLFLYAYGLIVFVLYSAYLWYSQDWYYYSMVFVGCIAAGCLFELLDEWLRLGRARFLRNGLWGVFLVCVVFISSRQCLSWWESGIRGWQIDMYRAAVWTRDNLPKDARIGSFNSGILAYYCPQRVINLDGVVNGAAYKAIKEGRIFSYLRSEKISHLVEAPLSIRFRSFQSAGDPVPLLKSIHVEGSYPEAVRRGNPVVVYEVMR
jgi:hypothetical protein